MDLNVLFASQIEQLKQCYVDLGHAPQRLQQALEAAVEQELAKTLNEVDAARARIEALERQCEAYRVVLDADGAQVGMTSADSSSSSSTTLTARIEQCQADVTRLERQYAARRAHVDRLIRSLEVYRPILQDFVPSIEGSGKTSVADNDDEGFHAVAPIPPLRLVESALSQCTDELQRRTDALQADLDEILQLWSELALLPSTSDDEGQDAQTALDVRILRHLGVTPRLVDVGEGCLDFCGDFEEVMMQSPSDGEDACETPCRKSLSHSSNATTFERPGAILPTVDNMASVQERRRELEEERTKRTETMQALYDELIPLWQRFDVADEDVDAFVQANCGCSLTVLDAYESELRQMRELKSQHMALFIAKVREDIAHLWDQLMMTPEERRDSFAPFFYDLSDGTSGDGNGDGGIEASDELLALHEEKVSLLQDELATRARPLELVRQYMRLLEEAKELEESAKDTSRLTGRGVPGQRRDPGRLLREEKMRKRIKILKPKVEEELLRSIPAWEEESGRPFIIHGQRFLDTIEVQSQPQTKKRQRTISQTPSSGSAAATAAAMATPQASNAKRNQLEGRVPSSARSVSASASSSTRRAATHQQPQSTPTAAAHGRHRNVTGPTSSASATPALKSTSGRLQKQPGAATAAPVASLSVTQPSTSSASLASQASNDKSSSTIVLKQGPRSNATSTMQPPPLPFSQGLRATPAKNRQAAAAPMKRPSILLEASLRHGPRPSSDYAKPTITGAGMTLRNALAEGAAANDSLGPNWAILPEDEDEENLLLM